MKEASSINLSLFHLARVVQALQVAQQKSTKAGAKAGPTACKVHIPYKDDALSHLLKDALGGNGTSVLIATVSPALTHAFETRSTLGFALSCGSIVNKARVNRRSKANQTR